MRAFIKAILFLSVHCIYPFQNQSFPVFVWSHSEPYARNEYVYFRNDFSLGSEIRTGEIHLFADSRYQIFVNEIFVGFGPARSYPQNPEYDSYNIIKYLRKGKNVISVKALYNGIENFQVPDNRPGFIAWGEIVCQDSTYSLVTKGNWVCRKSEGYDENAVRFSFACAAMEVYDGEKEKYDWKGINENISNWKSPKVIGNQNYWGKLTPRSIPHLTADEISAKSLISAFRFSNDEDIYQFRIKTPDEKRSDYYPVRNCLAYTYIYSPKDQEVEAGLWWGEFFLNGEGPLEGLGEDPKRPNRDPRILKLKEGWNFFNFYYGAIWGAWDFYMAIPKSAGLILSPMKDMNSNIVFMTAGPYEGDINKHISANKIGFTKVTELTDFYNLKWTQRFREEKTNNPALDMVWNLSEIEMAMPDWQTSQIEIPADQETALVFDIGRKTLGKYFIELDAPSGTIIDIGISEDLYGKKPWLFKRKMISAASRFIANGIDQRYETFKPYGFRYLQINITNNNLPVLIKKVGVVEHVYPFEKIGEFECSDPMFNSIWQLGWRSLRVCAEDSYTDTPFRERGLYAGDMLPEYAITLAGSGDSRLLKRSLKVFYDKYHEVMFGEEIPAASDFPLINIITTGWYYDISLDIDFIRFVYPGYKALLKRWLSSKDENGMMFMGRQFIEWTQIDKHSKLTATHALLSQALEIMSKFADILDKESDKEWFGRNSLEVKNMVKEKFWDKDKKLFNDGYSNGALFGKYYPSSNSWPMIFGCSDYDQDEHIIDYLEMQLSDIGEESRNRRITPYGAFYTIAALYKNGRPDIAEKFIRQYWTRMILNGDDTSWENFDIDGEAKGGGQGTASHAWSGHPTYFMSTEILGVNLGFHKKINRDKIIISPQTENITWAKGIVPHPLGSIRVHWKIEGDNLLLNYTCPENIKVEVLPKGKLSEKKLVINSSE
jgi:hypothetical protein